MFVAHLLVVDPHPAARGDSVFQALAEIEITVSAIRCADNDDNADALSCFSPPCLLCRKPCQLADHVLRLAIPLAQDVAAHVLPVVTTQRLPRDGKRQGGHDAASTILASRAANHATQTLPTPLPHRRYRAASERRKGVPSSCAPYRVQ